MCYAGLALKSLLKLMLRCKACHASNPASSAPRNQLHLAECSCRKSCLKICTVGCDVPRGVGPKNLLNVKLRCKACHAEERRAFCYTHSNSATAAPQNQANCTRPKICAVGCEVLRGVASKAPAVPLHFLLKRYVIANSPAIANTASNPGTPSSGVGV